MNDPRNIVVMYHANCYDGFGAYYAAWKALGDTATYIPMTYDQEIPKEAYEAFQVYMVDYSRSREELLNLLSLERDVCVLDHHKSARDALTGYEYMPYEAVFDMEKSGCVLAWEYFHPGKSVPRLLEFIQDRDLWRFKLEHTKVVHAALCSYPFDLELWDQMITSLDHKEHEIHGLALSLLIGRGKCILGYHDTLIDERCKEAELVSIGGYDGIPIVPVTMLFSEVPHKLLEMYPEAPFAATVYLRKGGVLQYGLRTRDSGTFDVSEVAKMYGGGGHKNAAGFVLQHPELHAGLQSWTASDVVELVKEDKEIVS